MKQSIRKLKAHYIVCGAGNTGFHMIEELYKTNRDFVVIESDKDVVARIEALFPKVQIITGDATDDDRLYEAGIEKAIGLASVLASDKDNMFLIVSAHKLNPDLRIISKIVESVNKDKFLSAGAAAVVSPSLIGGQRLSSELLRPNVVTYMDDMLRDRRNVRVEEIRIPEDSWVIGRKLSDLEVSKRMGIQIIAIREPDRTEIDYSPTGDYECRPGSILIITATPDKVANLAQFVSEKRTGDR